MLGLVLVVMLGIGLAEQSGYFEVLLTSLVEKAPKQLVIWMIIFVGIGDIKRCCTDCHASASCIDLFEDAAASDCRCDRGLRFPLGAFAANLIPGMSDAGLCLYRTGSRSD